MLASIGKWLGEMALSWLFNWIKAKYKLKKKINKINGNVDSKTDEIIAIADEIKKSDGKPTPEQKRKLVDAAKNSRTNR